MGRAITVVMCLLALAGCATDPVKLQKQAGMSAAAQSAASAMCAGATSCTGTYSKNSWNITATRP